jgi:hypothetical protein
MSENGMGNVDNRANIGNQTIINIQNMPGNIVLPGESGNSQPGKQNETVYFDEEFDGRVLMLDRALRRLSETIEKGDKKQSETVVCRFVDNLNETVSQSKRLINSVGELKTFVENITKLAEEWAVAAKEAETDTEESVKPLGLVFEDIKSALHSYFDFRQEYLLKRKFSLPQNATPIERMLSIFKQTVSDYRIYDFVYSDPCVSLSADLEMDVEYFVAVIKDRILLPFAYIQKDLLFLKISEFVQTIEAYNSYLSNRMRPINDRRADTFVPLHREDNISWAAEFQKNTLNFRKELDRIFGEITNGETLFIYDVSEDCGGSIPFLKYLSAVREYYRKLKTLLYDKTPKEFYSFYVCNDLKYNRKAIGNISAARLCSLSHFIIISGIGGLGKSMMMRHLLLNAIDNYEELKLLPIFIQLKDYGESTGDLHDYVYSAVKRFDENVTSEQLTAILESGSCLLLFDGLDEIKSAISTRVVGELESLACHYPQNHFVLSSRPLRQFVALNNFCELELQPFSKMQALKMIDNFEFSEDERKIKESFRNQLENELWCSHREFAENPLLLTIMLMSFEEYSIVPLKMYKFYEMAFETLARKHDDTKLLVREFKSGLSKDVIADYLAKICFLSYKDEKYELTESEFKFYFDQCQNNTSSKINADDFLFDISNNLCLLLLEGGKYRFVHRSFQEYFCAKNLKNGFEKVSTDKKELMSTGLIRFFNRRDSSDDKVLDMLYDMVPEKVEEFIIIPFLEKLLGGDFADDEDGYWAFLEKMYPRIKVWHEYHEHYEMDSETGEYIDESYYDFSIDDNGAFMANSKLYFFIIDTLMSFDTDNSTYYDNAYIMAKVPQIIEEFKQIEETEADQCRLIKSSEGQHDVIYEFSTFVKVEDDYWFLVSDVRKNPQKHANLLSVINSEDFTYKKAYHALNEYLNYLKSKQQATDDEWTEVFIQ